MNPRLPGLVAGLLLTSCLTAQAAGIERTAPTTRVLHEEGRYVELGFSVVVPELDGDGAAVPPALGGPALLSGNTGDLLETFYNANLSYKSDLGDRLSYTLGFDMPWGVNTAYPGGQPLPYNGVDASLTSYALTGMVAYDLTEQIKVYGGLRLQSMEAEAAIPFVGGYTVDTERDYSLGGAVGVSYSVPDIALRVALTYYSKIDHTVEAQEGTLAGSAPPSEIDISTPQSVNLEFQTGIATDTLLFGSVRWVDWSSFSIEPPNYPLGTLVDYEEDWTTYTLGIGRRFSDTWSGAIQASYEPASDTVLTTLGPIDGRMSIGVAGTYTMDNMKITGGVTYVKLGEATNILTTDFSGGSAIAAGLRIGWSL